MPHSAFIAIVSKDQFLFAHIVAEVLDVSALVVIALGFKRSVGVVRTPLVTGAAQHR